MSLPVVLRRVAQAEFDAADWYDQRHAGGGVAFTAAVRQALDEIAAQPDRFPEAFGDVREALVSGYPYALYYRVEPNRVRVLAVFHTSRDPATWQSRV